LRKEAARLSLSQARGRLYPSLSLFGGYGTGYFETTTDNMGNVIPFRNQIIDNGSKYIGVTLNIPILSKWSMRSRVNQQKIVVSRANNDLKREEQGLYQLIQQLVQSQQALVAERDQSIEQVSAQKITFEIAQKKYDKGLISTLELFQAKNILATAQSEKLQAQLRLKVNSSTLDFYNGLPVFRINSTNLKSNGY